MHLQNAHAFYLCTFMHTYALSAVNRKFASQGAPPVSTTPAANFATSFASVVDTGGKFVAGVNGNLPPVSTTPAANLPNNWTNIRLLIP